VLKRYGRAGWAAAPGFFTPAELAEIDRFTEETVALPEVSGAQMVYREPSLFDPTARVIQRIEDFCPHHPGFDALIRGGRLQRAVEQLLGAPAVLFKDKINFKMPGVGGLSRIRISRRVGRPTRRCSSRRWSRSIRPPSTMGAWRLPPLRGRWA